jgi:hypothetical protein
MTDQSEARELQESNAFDIARLQKNLKLAQAEAKEAYRQLSEAWQALEYFAGMDPMEAIKAHNYIMEDDGG